MIAVLAIPTAASAAPASRDPGLHVTRVKNPKYEVRPERVAVTYELQTVGRGTSTNVSMTVSFTRPGARRPSTSETVRLGSVGPGSMFSEQVLADVPIGRYEVKACVRFRHGKRRVIDCKQGKEISVIPFAWGGTATWTAHFGSLNNAGYRETADTELPSDALFTFSHLAPQGVFVYNGSGLVTYGVSGTDQAGCTHSGSGTHPIEASTLTLAQSMKTYSIHGERPSTQTFQATQTCPFGGSFPYTAPLFTPFWLLTGVQSKAVDATTLTGTHPETVFGGDWTWTFTAQGG